MRRKEAEFNVISLQLSLFCSERLSAPQTVPDTATTATLIRKDTNNAKPLSIRKNLHASCKNDQKIQYDIRVIRGLKFKVSL